MAPRWRYLLGEVGVGLRRNLLMTLATVITVTISLALLGIGMLIRAQVDLTRSVLYQDIELSIFLTDDITEQQRVAFQEELAANVEIDEVVYESKEQAYANARQVFSEQDDALLDSIGPEDMPASFRVSLFDPTRFDIVKSQYEQYPGVEQVLDQSETLERLFSVMTTIRTSAIFMAALQLLAATALIGNTIRVTAYARRDQTGIMKLVGATNWYIRLPFMLEGIAAGVAGALLAGVLLVAGVLFIVPGLQNQIQFVQWIGVNQVLGIIPLLVLIGGGIAAIAAFFSLRRFLDV